MVSAWFTAKSWVSRDRVVIDIRYTDLPSRRPRSVTVAPPGGMSARETSAPFPRTKAELRTKVDSAMARSRSSSVRGGIGPSKRTTSRQVYSSPLDGSMARRRLGPSQCWKPRRCRSYSSLARAARMASAWKVSRARGTRTRGYQAGWERA